MCILLVSDVIAIPTVCVALVHIPHHPVCAVVGLSSHRTRHHVRTLLGGDFTIHHRIVS